MMARAGGGKRASEERRGVVWATGFCWSCGQSGGQEKREMNSNCQALSNSSSAITRKRVVFGQQEALPSYAWCFQDAIGHEMPQGDDANFVRSVSRGVHDGFVCYRQEKGQTMASSCQQCTVTAKKHARERRGRFLGCVRGRAVCRCLIASRKFKPPSAT